LTARKKGEEYINDYNPELLMLWEANVDLQFIGENSYALNRYITAYITKSEKNATETIWNECSNHKTLQGNNYYTD
jgi:hypothetical protein